MLFWTSESLRFTNEKFLLLIKIAGKAFKGDCLRKLREASAFITISDNVKFFKNSAKNQFFTTLGAPDDFKIFDYFCTILKVLFRSNFLVL